LSLGGVVKGPEGVVLAADSRVTLRAQKTGPGGVETLPVNYDNATKLLTFSRYCDRENACVAAVTYGDAAIGSTPTDLRTAHSLLPEFEAGLVKGNRLPVAEFAEKLSDFFMGQWKSRGMPEAEKHQGSGMTFVVAGYNQGEPHGKVYLCNVPKGPKPVEQAPNDFGITFGGQNEYVARLMMGYDPNLPELVKGALNLQPGQMQILKEALKQLGISVPWGVLPLQDCIDLSIYLIKTTIAAQNLTIGLRGVGGPIDVAVITAEGGVDIVQQKKLTGE